MKQKDLLRCAEKIEIDGYKSVIWKKVEKWQKENNTSGLPAAWHINCTVLNHSVGTYGRNGILIKDNETGIVYGIPGRGHWVYLD